jgi:hypothetical protein
LLDSQPENSAKNIRELSAAQKSGLSPKNPSAKKPYSVFLPARASVWCLTRRKTLIGLDLRSLRVIHSRCEFSNLKSMKSVIFIVFRVNSLILGTEIHAKKLSTALSTVSKNRI